MSVSVITVRGLRAKNYKLVTKTLDSGRISKTFEPDGHAEFSVDLIIDSDRLAQFLGPRALVNKNGRSSVFDGAIHCRVRDREVVE